MHTSQVIRPATIAVVILVFFAATSSARAQGIALGGVGPVNRSMAGASTAAPIDAAGAVHWNPASISGMINSEMMFGLELLLPTEEISSTLGPFQGTTDGEPGVGVIPTIALVHKPEDSAWTYGLGLYGVAGFRVNYPGSATNPILTPQPSAASGGIGGLGRVFSEAELLQIVPTASYAVTDKLSIGIAPTVSLARVAIDPLFLTSPDDANGDGFPSYPSGRGTRYHWGGGFQVGMYYITDNCWHFGASVKSPQWFEQFRFFTEDENGGPRLAKIDFDYPLIVSLGTAYRGFENLLIACDVRYFDYENTDGFGPSGFDGTGAVAGLGWSSIMSVHTGMQYRMTDCLYLRAGYQFNQNPIHDNDAFFNVPAPLIIQHIVSVGASYELTCNLSISMAYVHGFENDVTGPWQSPLIGPIPGTSVTNTVSADAAIFGATVRY